MIAPPRLPTLEQMDAELESIMRRRRSVVADGEILRAPPEAKDASTPSTKDNVPPSQAVLMSACFKDDHIISSMSVVPMLVGVATFVVIVIFLFPFGSIMEWIGTVWYYGWWRCRKWLEMSRRQKLLTLCIKKLPMEWAVLLVATSEAIFNLFKSEALYSLF